MFRMNLMKSNENKIKFASNHLEQKLSKFNFTIELTKYRYRNGFSVSCIWPDSHFFFFHISFNVNDDDDDVCILLYLIDK